MAWNTQLSREKIQQILDQALNTGTTHVRFTGGEPLLRDDFINIYNYAYSIGIGIYIVTNGTLINSVLVKTFTERPPESIKISLYGWDSKSYSRITRTKGNFEKLIHGTNLLTKYGINFQTYYPPIRELIVNHDRIYQCAVKLGSKQFHSPTNWDLIKSVYRDYSRNKIIEKLRLKPDEVVSLMKSDGDRLENIKRIFHKQYTRNIQQKPLLGCLMNKDKVTIDTYGNLLFCMQLRHPAVKYDICQGSFEDAKTNFLPSLMSLYTNSCDYKKKCINCVLKPLCGLCPALSWLEQGTLDDPPIIIVTLHIGRHGCWG